jgi:ketosteroid isomerase-like protein
MAADVEGLRAAHLVSDKFTKFGPRRFDRQDVSRANESEAAFFGSISNFKQEVKDLKIDVFGDIGIATYYPHVSFVQNGEEKTGTGRQTLVFLKTENGWKIVHEHGTPAF